jgi:hypothetical protein
MKPDKGLLGNKAGVASYTDFGSRTSENKKVNQSLTEVFPCFFLSCKANARVILAKSGHGPHSSVFVLSS